MSRITILNRSINSPKNSLQFHTKMQGICIAKNSHKLRHFTQIFATIRALRIGKFWSYLNLGIAHTKPNFFAKSGIKIRSQCDECRTRAKFYLSLSLRNHHAKSRAQSQYALHSHSFLPHALPVLQFSQIYL